jgi:hypothetical protein
MNVSSKMLCVVIVRYMKKKETNYSNKAQHVPHQENISYPTQEHDPDMYCTVSLSKR